MPQPCNCLTEIQTLIASFQESSAAYTTLQFCTVGLEITCQSGDEPTKEQWCKVDDLLELAEQRLKLERARVKEKKEAAPEG